MTPGRLRIAAKDEESEAHEGDQEEWGNRYDGWVERELLART